MSSSPSQNPSQGSSGGLPNTLPMVSDDNVATCALILFGLGEITMEQLNKYTRDEAKDDIDGLTKLVDDVKLKAFRRTSYRSDDPRSLLMQYALYRTKINSASTTESETRAALSNHPNGGLPSSHSRPSTSATPTSSDRNTAPTQSMPPPFSRPFRSVIPRLWNRNAAPMQNRSPAFSRPPTSASPTSSNRNTATTQSMPAAFSRPPTSASPNAFNEYTAPTQSMPPPFSRPSRSATPTSSDRYTAPTQSMLPPFSRPSRSATPISSIRNTAPTQNRPPVSSRPPTSASPNAFDEYTAPTQSMPPPFSRPSRSATPISSDRYTAPTQSMLPPFSRPSRSATPISSIRNTAPTQNRPPVSSRPPTSASPNAFDEYTATSARIPAPAPSKSFDEYAKPNEAQKRKREVQNMSDNKRQKTTGPPPDFLGAKPVDDLDVTMHDATNAPSSDKKVPVEGAKETAVLKMKQPKRDTHVVELPYPKNGGRIDEYAEQLSDVQDIFDHLTARACELGFDTALNILDERVINVATMCSGTESPLLALKMIASSLKQRSGKHLNYDHLFSAEIVPYKQAYIERNFSPKLLFRDIRELADRKSTKASTAYGANAKIPGNVDLIIAGFACVDFSKLNTSGKAFGESSDTFLSILEYARKYSPAILILENVSGAPWDKLKAIWQDDKAWIKDIGRTTTSKTLRMNTAERKFFVNFWKSRKDAYYCEWVLVDTKEYYLPHTRKRGYMICLSKKAFGDSADAKKLVTTWRQIMGQLQRRASISVEAILMADDDQRVSEAKAEFSKTAKDVRIEADWETCQAGYQDYREQKLYGTGRPITNWINGGTAKAPDYWWPEWFSVQVARIWETFDVAYLRNVVREYDSFFKVRVWELSQNVFRFDDSVPFGVVGCITPTGMPFLTTRGGPLTGREALALQGISKNEVLLTRESQRELQEMAGNAMSTTVVGAAILAALIVGAVGLTKRINKDSLVEPLKVSMSPVVMDCSKLGPKRPLDLVGCEPIPVADLRSLAEAGSQRCQHEGQTMTTKSRFLECKLCHNRSCKACSGLPRHSYQFSRCQMRIPRDPYIANTVIKSALPLSLQMFGVSLEELRATARVHSGKEDGEDWTDYWVAVESVFTEDYRYRKSKRAENWTITYEGQVGRLELVCGKAGAQWLLYAKIRPSLPLKSRSRELFRQPLAKMTVASDNILTGSWLFRLPSPTTFRLVIEGEGKLVPYWESMLGIRDPDIAEKRIWSFLEVSLGNPSVSTLDHDVSGVYHSLRKCGTASGFLYKKVSPIENIHTPPLYLFLDPDRVGDPKSDQFVVSTDIHRLHYGETRDVILRLDASWRPSTTTKESCWTPQCFLDGEWRECKASLRATPGLDSAFHQVLKQGVSIPASLEPQPTVINCKNAYTALLHCELPIVALGDGMEIDQPWETVSLAEERKTLINIDWITDRIRSLDGYANDWTPIDVPVQLRRCQTCAPDMPVMKWRLVLTKSANTVKPYEDGRTAGAFERAMKARPTPFYIQVKRNNDVIYCLQIGINIPTLAHRAYAKLGRVLDSDDIRMSWSFDARFRLDTEVRPQAYSVGNTLEGQQHGGDHVFRNEDGTARKKQLRYEQQSSFKWMKAQESPDSQHFDEQEIEEAIIPNLGWRASVRATRSHKVRGGVLADEVGYGKTATMLGLIDDDKDKARISSAKTDINGSIQLKATLVIVPPTLVHQWKAEVHRFIGRRFTVLTISSNYDLKAMSVARFKEADIIIISWAILERDTYLKRVALFAALPEISTIGGRPFSAWLSLATSRIEELTRELQNSSSFDEVDDHIAATIAQEVAAQVATEDSEESEEDERYETFEKTDDEIDEVSAGESVAREDDEEPAEGMEGATDNEGGDGTAAQDPGEYPEQGLEVASDGGSDEDLEATHEEGSPENSVKSLLTDLIQNMGPKSEEGPAKLEAGHPSESSKTKRNIRQAELEAGDPSEHLKKKRKRGPTAARRVFVERLKARLNLALNDQELLRAVPTQRLRGARYAEDAKRRRDGVRPVEFSPQAVDDDDFADLNVASLDKLTGPCLQMFKFRRIVIDEWTYLNTRTYIYVRTLKCSFRWTLSGTPPLDDFAGVHRMAAYIHVNLGIVDDAPGAQTHESIRSLREDRTKVESVLSYGRSYSTAWHMEKQQHAQRFLDHSVRQNQADITLMEVTVEYRVIEMDSTELIYYRELQQHVESHAMKLVIQGQSKAERELQEQKKLYLRGNKSAAEALLKTTSYFSIDLENAEVGSLALDACATLHYYRRRELRQHLHLLRRHLHHAMWLLNKCKGADAEFFWSWISAVREGVLGDRESTNLFLGCVLDAEKKCVEEDEVLWYREKPDVATKKREKKWTDDRKLIARRERQVMVMAQRALNDGKKKPAPIEPPEPLADGSQRAWAWFDRKVQAIKIPPPPVTQAIKILRIKDGQIKAAPGKFGKILRNLVAVLRSYGKELPTRVRSLRLIDNTRKIRDWIDKRQKQPEATVKCYFCHEQIPSPEDLLLNIRCGHMMCSACCEDRKEVKHCRYHECDAPAGTHLLKPATQVIGDDSHRHPHGNKIQAVIDLIRSINRDEQVLLFVQFKDMMVKVNAALKAAGIRTSLLASSGANTAKVMKKFQTYKGARKSKVLVLNPSSETAAGINLINANHVIFLAPLHCETQARYDAAMKQCIGRALRSGQEKVVKVYHFLIRGSFDVDLLQERTHAKLVKRLVKGVMQFQLVPYNELSHGEMIQEWGTGNKDMYYKDS